MENVKTRKNVWTKKSADEPFVEGIPVEGCSETANLNDKPTRVKANEFQQRAIKELKKHVFGSERGYIEYRESNRKFPKFYVTFKNIILHCDDEEYNDEFFVNLIKLCPKAQIISERVTTANSEKNGAGTRGEAVLVDHPLAVNVRYDGTKGTRAKSTAQDPKCYTTYRNRVSVYQSKLRASNYNETEVLRAINIYTNRYNEKFGTDFEVYYSKKTAKVNK